MQITVWQQAKLWSMYVSRNFVRQINHCKSPHPKTTTHHLRWVSWDWLNEAMNLWAKRHRVWQSSPQIIWVIASTLNSSNSRMLRRYRWTINTKPLIKEAMWWDRQVAHWQILKLKTRKIRHLTLILKILPLFKGWMLEDW